MSSPAAPDAAGAAGVRGTAPPDADAGTTPSAATSSPSPIAVEMCLIVRADARDDMRPVRTRFRSRITAVTDELACGTVQQNRTERGDRAMGARLGRGGMRRRFG